MPFGLALSLAGSLRDDLVRGHGEARHFLLIAERSDFWITPQVPDQDHMIDHCPTPPAARAFPKAATPLRAPTWAVTVTGDQPPPTRCSAPSPEQPQRTFLAGPLTHCRRVQPEKSEAGMRAARRQCAVGSRGALPSNP